MSVPEIDFDHRDPALAGNYRQTFRELRAKCPIAHSSAYGGFYVITQYDDMVRVWGDPETFSSQIPGLQIPPTPFSLGLLNLDPPEHTGYRRAFVPAFSAPAVKGKRPRIRELVEITIDGFIERGRFDVVSDLAMPFLTVSILDLLGMPLERCYQYLHVLFPNSAHGSWYSASREKPADGTDPMAGVNFVMDDIRNILRTGACPPGSVVHEWQHAIINGQAMTEEELVLTIFVFLAGGTENMSSVIGQAFDHFSRHPDHQRLLAEQPGLLPRAIEELIRYYPGATTNVRKVMKPVRLAGADLRAGDLVMMAFVSGNETIPTIEAPEELRLDREKSTNISFGYGRHRCIAAHLAQVELETVFERVFARLPDFRIDRAGIVRHPIVPQVDGFLRIPATFTPGPRSGHEPLDFMTTGASQ